MASTKATLRALRDFVGKAWSWSRRTATRVVQSPNSAREERLRCLLEHVGVAAASLLFCVLLTLLMRFLLNIDKLTVPLGVSDFRTGVFAFWGVFAFVWIAASLTYHFTIRNTLSAAPESNATQKLAWVGVLLLVLLGAKVIQECLFQLLSWISRMSFWADVTHLTTPLVWIVVGEVFVILVTLLVRKFVDRRSYHIRLLGVSAPWVIGTGWAAFVLSSMWIYPWLVTSAYVNLENAYLQATPIQSVLASDIYFDSPEITISPGPRSPADLRVRSATQEDSLLGRRILQPLFERLSVIPQGVPLEDLSSEEAYVEMVDWFLKNIIEDEAIRHQMDGSPSPDENDATQKAFQTEELALARYLTSADRTIPGFSTELLLAYSGALPSELPEGATAAAEEEEEEETDVPNPGDESTEDAESPPAGNDSPSGSNNSTAAEEDGRQAFQSERDRMARWIASRLAGTQPKPEYPFSEANESSDSGEVREDAPDDHVADNASRTIPGLVPWDILGTPSQPDDVETVRALLRWEGPSVAPAVDLSGESNKPPFDWEREARFQSSFRSFVTELISASHSDPSVQASRFKVALFQGAEQLAMLVLTVWSILILATRWIVVFRRSSSLNKLLDSENSSGDGVEAGNSEDPTGESEGAKQFLKLVLTGKLSAGDFGTKRRQKNVLDRKERREGIDLAERKTRSSRWLLSWLTTALPAIGFIGTVRGISAGLENADAIVRAGSSIEQAGAINLVAGQLGVAFTTTLIALVLGLLVTFVERMQNAGEVRFLNRLRDVVQQPEGG